MGAQVALANDRVQVRLPAGVALPEALQAALQARREAVVAFLRRQENRERRLLLAWERAFRRVPPHPPADHPARCARSPFPLCFPRRAWLFRETVRSIPRPARAGPSIGDTAG